MNDSPSSDPNEYQGPAWRNPWLIAFIAGAITITILRDCTRRVPDAPLSLGAVPTWSLLDVSGTQYSSETLSGRVHILAFGAKECSGPESLLPQADEVRAACGIATEAATELLAALDRKQATAELIMLDPSTDWDAALELSRNLAALDNRTIDNPWDIGFVLVDGSGQCRGFYGLHDEGQDEVLHRSQHVVRDAAKGL